MTKRVENTGYRIEDTWSTKLFEVSGKKGCTYVWARRPEDASHTVWMRDLIAGLTEHDELDVAEIHREITPDYDARAAVADGNAPRSAA